MTVVKPGKNASFMVVCRTNYFHDVRPADPLSKKAPGFTEAVAIARAYFTAGRQEEFRNYLSEAKYLVNLWAAHLILEQGQPDPALSKECLEVIERYAASPFDAVLAQQEQHWLHAYLEVNGGASK